MKLTPLQIQKLVEKVFNTWKAQGIVTFKEDEPKVFARAVEVVKQNYQAETELERDVHKMLDDLERTNPGDFQRHKMFGLIKQKLAKERKMVL